MSEDGLGDLMVLNLAFESIFPETTWKGSSPNDKR